MKIAIISDIHSNLEALEKALETIDQKGVDEIVCLGDIIGYGANPNECLDLIRVRAKHILMGNHESVIANPDQIRQFTPNARIAAAWTLLKLTEENKNLIKELPLTAKTGELLFVHSSPFEPKEWHYLVSGKEIKFNFDHFSEKICFFGHTHVPGTYPERGTLTEIDRADRFLINVGSVGQPRDHDPRLSFGIIDTEGWEYENVRLEYDAIKTSRKISEAGLPAYLAERILAGT